MSVIIFLREGARCTSKNIFIFSFRIHSGYIDCGRTLYGTVDDFRKFFNSGVEHSFSRRVRSNFQPPRYKDKQQPRGLHQKGWWSNRFLWHLCCFRFFRFVSFCFFLCFFVSFLSFFISLNLYWFFIFPWKMRHDSLGNGLSIDIILQISQNVLFSNFS